MPAPRPRTIRSCHDESVTPDDFLIVLVVPLGLAVLGVVGVAVGAWMSARASLRGRLIDINEREAGIQRAFGIRVVAAVSELGIATAQIIDDGLERGILEARQAQAAGETTVLFAYEESLVERLDSATEEWRTVLAASQYHTTGSLAEALYAFDRQRSVVVHALNAASNRRTLTIAKKESDTLRKYHSGQVFRLLQVDKIRSTARIYHLAHVLRLRHFAKSLSVALNEDMAMGEKLVKDAATAHEAQSSRSA
jgi:hypothetical protein